MRYTLFFTFLCCSPIARLAHWPEACSLVAAALLHMELGIAEQPIRLARVGSLDFQESGMSQKIFCFGRQCFRHFGRWHHPLGGASRLTRHRWFSTPARVSRSFPN